MADKAEIIEVPNTLKNKVSYGPGGVDLEAIEKAEAVIAGLQDTYLEWVQDDLNRIAELYDKAVKDVANRSAIMKDVFRISHDVKGQGGSFDYHLMTTIGNQLCRFLERCESFGDHELMVVKVHLDAMRLVIAQRLTGDGGQVGEGLVKGLQAVLSKVMK